MKETNSSTSQEADISWHVVAFLDLLGQQDKLRHITALPDQTNFAEVEAFKRAVMEMYAPVKTLRTIFLSSIKSFTTTKADENTPGLPENLLKEFRSCPINAQTFSDSVIAHIPLHNEISLYPCRAIYGVLCAASLAFLACLSRGFPIRGGIDLGLAFNINTDEIYGPALARAYTYESKIAGYPRIVIGEELVRYLNAIAASSSTDVVEILNASTAKQCLGMLTEDVDGHAILDYLGDDLRGTLQKMRLTDDVIRKAYDFVLSEFHKYNVDKNSKLGTRYTLLRKYFEARLPDWGVEL